MREAIRRLVEAVCRTPHQRERNSPQVHGKRSSRTTEHSYSICPFRRVTVFMCVTVTVHVLYYRGLGRVLVFTETRDVGHAVWQRSLASAARRCRWMHLQPRSQCSPAGKLLQDQSELEAGRTRCCRAQMQRHVVLEGHANDSWETMAVGICRNGAGGRLDWLHSNVYGARPCWDSFLEPGMG